MLLLIDEFLDFKKEIQKKEFSSSRICESRWIKHWISKELLFEDMETKENKWNKFSFVELIWLKAILKMRKFGLALEDISIIKNGITYKSTTNSNNIKGFLDILAHAILRLKTDLVYSKTQDNDGQLTILGMSDNKEPFQSYLSISINGLIRDFILDFNGETNDGKHLINILRYNLMTQPEVELLDLIRRGGVKEFQIYYQNDGKTIKNNSLKNYVDLILQSNYKMIKYRYNEIDLTFKRSQ